MACVRWRNCDDYGGYLYLEDGEEECVSVEDCMTKKKGHVYDELKKCVKMDPATDGRFVQRTDNVYMCASGWRSFYSLLYFGDTAKCVSYIECYVTLKCVYNSSRCISRE